MPPDWSNVSMFDHPGVVHAALVPYPQPHFLIQGYVEAIQSCVTTFIVHQLDIRMDQFAMQQRLVARQMKPPVPAFYLEPQYHSAYSAVAPASTSAPTMHRPTVAAHIRTMEEIQNLLHLRATLRQRQEASHRGRAPPPPPPAAESAPPADYCQDCGVIHTALNSHPNVTSSLARPAPTTLQNVSTSFTEHPARPMQSFTERPARPTRPLPSQRGRPEGTISPEGQQGISSSADADSRRVILWQPDHSEF
jgi:hypothetical protein